MSESELSRALVARDTPPGAEVGLVVGRVLERDRRRMRLLTVMTLVLWLLAASGVLLLVWFFFTFVEPKLTRYQQESGGRDAAAWVRISGWAAWCVAGLASTVFLAAGSTVWLVVASRRATLGQVNARLAEIGEQLRRIEETTARPTPPAGGGG